ncbi:cation diffusion facilitator family transporter [Thalassotalea marina]|uniref:Cation efflux system protein n=1 Tax=Thalassotalea marina TaxID=1673741 RepID=A0A919BAM8_9GAMM|nr:cation diffusion facilitator family transporter [Thalassotalea marina]GHF79160.1 cation efflux system protein [Thalassotalea marina]
MSNVHHHHHSHDGKLSLAVFINILLTIAQVIGGLVSGSLSLIADALHNLSDAGAILIAMIARKIARKSANSEMTFGYQRAEIIGALINSTTLILIGLYLIYEAFSKFINPESIDGWIVVWIAGIALVIDVLTAVLTYKSGAKDNLNLKAAFIHNISDALASVVVIISGTLIILYQWYIVDLIATIGISVYVIYHGIVLAKQTIRILMQATPVNIDIEQLTKDIEQLDMVDKVQHIHVWQLDDKSIYLEASINLKTEVIQDLSPIKQFLAQHYGINHATLETVTGSSLFNRGCYEPE